MTRKIETINDIIALQKELDTAIEKNGERVIKSLFKEFFQNYPEVKAVAWTQYTPYFMDGDPCEFSVYEIYGASSDSEEAVSDLENGECEEGTEVFYDHEGLNGLSEILQSKAGHIILEAVFGDHKKIVVTQNGIEVERCRHD